MGDIRGRLCVRLGFPLSCGPWCWIILGPVRKQTVKKGILYRHLLHRWWKSWEAKWDSVRNLLISNWRKALQPPDAEMSRMVMLGPGAGTTGQRWSFPCGEKLVWCELVLYPLPLLQQRERRRQTLAFPLLRPSRIQPVLPVSWLSLESRRQESLGNVFRWNRQQNFPGGTSGKEPAYPWRRRKRRRFHP